MLLLSHLYHVWFFLNKIAINIPNDNRVKMLYFLLVAIDFLELKVVS